MNFYTGRTFETEHNQGKIPDRAWAKLRQASDELCKKHGLSVIDNAEQSRGQSHWEWEMDQQKLSWKAKLKAAIDEVIMVSESFEDFLMKCADFGILVEYNPDHKIDLKFMLAEQKERNPRAKFTRAKTLGWFYESRQIAKRIESYKYLMNNAPKVKIIRTTSEKFQQSPALSAWADRQNMKAASKALNEMTASNSTLEELESAAHIAMAKFTTSSAPMRVLEDKLKAIRAKIPVIEEFMKYQPYHKQYISLEGRAKAKYKDKNLYELEQYSACAKKMKETFPDAKYPTLKKLQDELDTLQSEYDTLSAERKAYKKEADRLVKAAQQKRDSQRTVNRYLQNEQDTKRKKGTLE